MKKLLILLLLSITTIFTQVNAQQGYLSFDGVNDFVNVGTLSNWGSQNLDDFKIEIQFSSTSQNTNNFLLGFNQDNGRQRLFIEFGTDENLNVEDDNLSFFLRDEDGNDINMAFNSPQSNIYDGSINTLTVEYQDNGSQSILFNGNDLTAYGIQQNPTQFINLNEELVIGARNQRGTIQDFSEFKLYDFKIYNGSTLFLHYDLSASNAVQGNQLIDQVGNNDGTIVGATYNAPSFQYPAEINLDSNYGDYFDVDIQFQDEDELYQDYPISAQSADVNDDWQATAPFTNIGSFTFQDWYDLDNNVVFSTNPSISITGPDRDYNLRARYTGVTEYDINLNMESGISGNIAYQGNTFSNNNVTQFNPIIAQAVPAGTAWEATAPNVAGQNFDGWFLPNGTLSTTSQTISSTDTQVNFDLEARYSPIPTYTVNVSSNIPNNPPDLRLYHDSNDDNIYTLETPAPTISKTYQEGVEFYVSVFDTTPGFYTFEHWLDLDTNTILTTNASWLDNIVSQGGNGIQQDWNLKAVFSLPPEYQINLTLTSQIGNIQFQVDNETPILAPEINETIFAGQDFQATAPSDPSYEFQHWYDLENNQIFNIQQAISAVDVDRDYILEARYLEIFDITFDSNGGTTVESIQATSGSAIDLPEPSRVGFAFGGWYETSDPFAVVVSEPFTVTGDIDFTAFWIPIITVNFNSNGGSPVDSQSVSTAGIITEPAIPSRFGYQFDGWYLDNNTFANEYNFTSPIPYNFNFTLHAKWVIGSDSDVNQTLTNWINNSGLPTMVIVIVIMLAVTVTLGVINAQMFVIIITNLSLLFVFTSLGFIPLWILLVAGLVVLGFTIMIVFGGNRNV